MRIVISLILVFFAATQFDARGASQKSENPNTREKNMFAANELFAKGGIGIINESLYIVLKSAKNELRLGAGDTWIGLEASKPQVVVLFEGKIWLPQTLPDHFDLSRAILVSFEEDKVRFFDFSRMSGGYYKRTVQR